MSKITPPNPYAIGKIVKPHGLKGEVKILLYDQVSGYLTEKNTVWLQDGSSTVTVLRVESCSLNGPYPRIKFFDIDSRIDAENLRNLEVLIDRDLLPPPEPEGFLLADLIGLTVLDEHDVKLGVINDAYPLPANDIIELNYNGKDILIPMIEDIIKLIDFENQTVKITVMEGLLDL